MIEACSKSIRENVLVLSVSFYVDVCVERIWELGIMSRAVP